MLTLKYYSDPGHGWIKVDHLLIQSLGLSDKITTYSYQRKDSVYLEEDCDAELLLNALDINGIKYKLIRLYTNKQSRIRNYKYYNNRIESI